jgi:hypothetical protein
VKSKYIFAFALVLLLWVAVAKATTVIPMSVEELTRASTDIIEARAVDSRSAWNAQHTLIYTYTTYEVMRALKGAAAQRVTVKQLGGSAEGYTQKVSGVHHAQTGEDGLLFLRPSAGGDGTYVVVGLVQGNFRVLRSSDGGALVTNGISGAHAAERGASGVTDVIGSMTLNEAEARIRRAMQ